MKSDKQTLLSLALILGLSVWGYGQDQLKREIERFDQEVAKLKPTPQPIDIAIDVIGLDIQQGSAAEDQLSQVAAAAAGAYYPVQDEKDLATVFTQVTTGQTTGGGSGWVLPASGISVWVWGLLGFLLVGIVVLALSLVTIRRRKPAKAGRIQAYLDVRYLDGRHTTFEIREPQTTIGRAPGNSLVIHDSDVSAYHAEIVVTKGEFSIRDLGSTNGTWVNGNKVKDISLFRDDEILIGATKLYIRG